MRVSLELVPHSQARLEEKLIEIKNRFNEIDTINIPDIVRFDLRSYHGCEIAKRYYNQSIPHLRAIDFDLKNMDSFYAYLKATGINEVLILKGDIPEDRSKKIYHTSSIDLISDFKKNLPDVKVYAAIDQYRSSMKDEYTYIKHKINAGADGFFTQPFFDIRLIEIYSDMLEDIDLYIGVSPVTSERSANYWRTKNNVLFPKGFEPTLKWSGAFTKKALEYVSKRDRNIYLMPISIDASTYLNEVFQ